MNVLILPIAFLLTGAALALLHPVAGHLRLLDRPDGRKTHTLPTPMTGGLAIYAALLLSALFTPAVQGDYLNLLLISGLLVVVGVIDDVNEMRASARILAQALAAWLMVALTGVQLESLGNIFGFGNIELGALGLPLTIFAIIGVINAVNMSDGLDGLAGGKVLISLVFLSILTTTAGHHTDLMFKPLLIVVLLAFLIINYRWLSRRPALAYLGDAGSTMIGFFIAWLLVENTQGDNAIMAPVTALWLLAIPLIDTVALLVRRPLAGRSPFAPGRDHLHHLLLQRGYSHHTTVAILYSAAVVLGCIGLLGHFLQVSEAVMFAGFLVIFGLQLLLTRKLATATVTAPASQPAGDKF